MVTARESLHGFFSWVIIRLRLNGKYQTVNLHICARQEGERISQADRALNC